MKSGVFGVHFRGLASVDFGRDPHSSDSGKARRIFLSGKQRTILPISRRPNFTKFSHNTSIGVAMKHSEENFDNFPVRGRFSEKKR